MPSRSRVAVIGAGAAGLVAARELRREGHTPVFFERAAAVGGTWRYEDAADPADPLGAGGAHSSLYASLRTNLPRECMGFLDFPFVADCSSADPRRFPGHQEVLRYLEEFARRFDLYGLIRFGTEVVSVRRSRDDDAGAAGWRVSYCSRRLAAAGSELEEEEVFDAVVVCNGHFAEPRLADIAASPWARELHLLPTTLMRCDEKFFRICLMSATRGKHRHLDGGMRLVVLSAVGVVNKQGFLASVSFSSKMQIRRYK